MKKKILIIVSVVVLVAIVVGSIIFLPKLFNKNSNSESSAGNNISVNKEDLKSGSEMLHIGSIAEIKPYAEAYGFSLTTYEEDDKITVNDAVCCDIPLQINYLPGENEDDLYQVEVYYIPFSSEYRDIESPKFTHSGDDLKGEIEKFFKMIEYAFNVNVNGQYFIISNEGELLDNNSNAAYDSLISGNAVIDFTLRDSNGYYWILSSGLSEEGLVYFNFTNYFDLYIYSENIAHVAAE